MTKEFTASNGVTLSFDEEGRFTYSEHGDDPRLVGKTETEGWWGFTRDSRNSKALAEYYRAKEDERLGRFRYGQFLVYPDEGPDDVMVVDETAPDELWRFARDSISFRGDPGSAARAFFDAHPEPKPPWHEAKPGVWLLTFREGTLHEGAYVAGDWSFVAADHAVPKDDPRITSARKIWPQDEPAIDDLSYDA